ncbi:PREDICTED: uncharacterized protein LOC109238615 [Nicotiana attenuata]|uniref:uncharacterized protein LOC109238615 n=1 Tax=Nicotiana attenuata TaxID=49451 RepID=UPI0009053115|nr:PREDICTED: uncharacterized protein LOC109238615 [Nicotiana attenuata]
MTIGDWMLDYCQNPLVGTCNILAATDYFLKWAEVVALEEVKKENVANFIRVSIIYRFGIPCYIILDNGKLLDNKLMNKICDLFFFKQHNSSMYNVVGLAEAFNKTICNLFKKVVSKYKLDWHDRMEEALWVYNSPHTDTSNSLVTCLWNRSRFSTRASNTLITISYP